jgi:hypothetical protein
MSEWQPARLINAHGIVSPFVEAEKVGLKKVVRVRDMGERYEDKDCDGKKFLTHSDDLPGGSFCVCEHEILTD